MSEIRILQIFRNLNIGGSQTLVMNLYKNMDKTKVQFDFIVSEDGYYDEQIKEMGGKIYKIDYITKVGQSKYKKQLIKFFETHSQYKVIHSHIDQVSGIVMEAAKEAHVPVRISHSHSTNNTNNLIYKIYKKYLQNKIIKNATHLFACSEQAAKWLFKKRFKEATIIRNGIDTSKFKYSLEDRKRLRKQFNILDNELLWGHVGNFLKVKNHTFLLEVFYEYTKLDSNIKLMLVGDGILRETIEKKIKMLNIEDKVVLLGNRNDVSSLCSAFDIYVFPSLYEGISTAMIEAQAEGLKVFTSNNINRLTNISETMKFISLDLSAVEWAKIIYESDKTRNENMLEKVQSSGYDIKFIAEKLENKYIELYES